MRTVGFSGKSGTGKSYRALNVASEKGIKLIVDDGLLICEGKVLAGKSAKKERSPYSSTLRAIFNDTEHSEAVAEAIKKSGENSILILGTSEKMVNLIADRLGVSPVDEHIHIEDVASEEEINTANLMRSKYGKHVIPVPTIEIKRTFSGYLLDPIASIKKLADEIFDKNSSSERTIVRPAYGYIGDFEISERVLYQIAQHEAQLTEGVKSVDKIVYYSANGVNEFRIDVTLVHGTDFVKTCSEIKERVIRMVDECASIYIDAVNVNVVKVSVEN